MAVSDNKTREDLLQAFTAAIEGQNDGSLQRTVPIGIDSFVAINNFVMTPELTNSFATVANSANSVGLTFEQMEQSLARQSFTSPFSKPGTKTVNVKIHAIDGPTLYEHGEGSKPIRFEDKLGRDQVMNSERGNGDFKDTLLRHRLDLSRRICHACDTCPAKKVETNLVNDKSSAAYKIITQASCEGNCPDDIVEKSKQLTKAIRAACKETFQDDPRWIQEVTVSKKKIGVEPVVVNSSRPIQFDSQKPLTPEEELALLTQDIEDEGIVPSF